MVSLKASDRLLFLKYAIPCAETLVQRKTISQKFLDGLLNSVKKNIAPKGEPEKIFKVAYAMCTSLALDSGKKGFDKKIIRDYFWFGHDDVIKERFELMRDFDPSHCKTYPGKVEETRNGTAIVLTCLGEKKYSTDFLPSAKKGDYVVVHRGFAVEKITKKQALEFAQRTGKKIRP